jgi:pimeloyl-ACP methyl ester carboxylesterase
MAEIKKWRHYADGGYGQVHIVSAQPADTGAITAPPLICFHPSPTSGDIYRDLQLDLARDRIVHCVDTPGFGGSDGPRSKPTMADYGAALAPALAHLGHGPRNPCDVFGFHTGSLVAVETALHLPKGSVRRMVLSGVPHYTPEERARQRAGVTDSYPILADPDYVGATYKRLVLDGKDAGELEQRYYRFMNRLRAGPQGAWGANAVFEMDTAAALPRLSMPVLLIAFNEMMTQPTRDAASIIPNVKLVEMLDQPMFGFITAPAKVAAAMREFLDVA